MYVNMQNDYIYMLNVFVSSIVFYLLYSILLLGADQLHNWPQNPVHFTTSYEHLHMCVFLFRHLFIFINEFSITRNVLHTLVDLIILVLTKKPKKTGTVSLGYYTGKNLGKHFFYQKIFFVNLVAPIFDIICMQDAAQFCRQAG